MPRTRRRAKSPSSVPVSSHKPQASSPEAWDQDYDPQKGIKDEEDELEYIQDAHEVDPKELKIDNSRRSKRKRTVDSTYRPGRDEDGDETSPSVVVEDTRPKKRKTAAKGATKANASKKTPVKKTAGKLSVIGEDVELATPRQGNDNGSSSGNGVVESIESAYPTPDTGSSGKETSNTSRSRGYRKTSGSSGSEDDEDYTGLDKSPAKRAKRKARSTPEVEYTASVSSGSDYEEYRNTHIRREEQAGIVFDFSVEKAKRWASAINIPDGLYNDEEKDLFFRLAMRGFEPIVPNYWRHDFPTLPESLYPRNEEGHEKPLIDVTKSSDIYATRALANLFATGGHVRDTSIMHTRPEPLIKQAINHYIKWAFYDSDLNPSKTALPVHVIYDQKKHETTLQALRAIKKRLRKLVNQHSDALRITSARNTPAESEELKYPLLIGIIICGPIFAIVTHTTDPEEGADNEDGRFISQFDLSERGQDVWNSFAIAIAVMHIRRTMLWLAKEGRCGYSMQVEREVVDDVDL